MYCEHVLTFIKCLYILQPEPECNLHAVLCTCTCKSILDWTQSSMYINSMHALQRIQWSLYFVQTQPNTFFHNGESAMERDETEDMMEEEDRHKKNLQWVPTVPALIALVHLILCIWCKCTIIPPENIHVLYGTMNPIVHLQSFRIPNKIFHLEATAKIYSVTKVYWSVNIKASNVISILKMYCSTCMYVQRQSFKCYIS